MAKTYEQLLEQAAIIRDETAAGKNTATRVGGTITDAVDYVKNLQDTYAGIHAEASEAKTEAAAANTKNAEQDGKISSLEVKDATHDTKIAKLEERVLQYLYPKIYQLNEGAGARKFNGFTKATGEGAILLKKDTYRYRVLYSTTQKQFVLNVTDEASGAGVRVGTFAFWGEISLPNNKFIASSESYALRDCLYYIYVEGEGSTYYYIDSNGNAVEASATYLLRILVNKNASDIATLQGKDATQDGEIATLHERDTALDGKISALEAKDIEHNAAIVRNATVEYYDHSVTDGPSRINTRAIFKFFGADGNQLFTAPLLGAGDGYPGLLSLKNKTKLDNYADTFKANPVASSESNGLMSADDKSKLDSVDEIIDLPWDDEVQGQDGYINNFTERGEYHIHGERLYDNDGLPILNAASGHTIDGLMTVLDSSLPNGNKYDVCVTQILRLNNRVGGDGHIYIRTGIAATKSELQRSTADGWSPWEKLMGVFEKNAVSNATDLNEYTSSGMYDGMFVFSPESQTTVSGLKIESGSTFLMVSVNGYAVAQTGVVPQVTQLLYVMPSGLDGSSGVRNAKLYTRTGIYVASTKTYTWGKFDGLAQASDITKLLGYIQENSALIQENQSAISANTKEIARVNSTATRAQEDADRAQEAANTAQTAAQEAKDSANTKIAELAGKVNGKQDALTLTVKDNGNIVLANIQGQSKEFMPATPSGDPMHYAFVTAGAEYNDTGADIVKDAPWADLADDDADKTVVHKAGYWYLNGLGDITNEQMQRIYMLTGSNQNYWHNYCSGQDLRTNIMTINENSDVPTNIMTAVSGLRRCTIEVIKVPTYESYTNSIPLFNLLYVEKLKFIIGVLKALVNSGGKFIYNLKGIKIFGIYTSATFPDAKNLSMKSVLYMINNEAATSPITITLHADVYNRCMANEDIFAALEAHTNISIASA